MERVIEVGKVYKHFKGHVYEVIVIATDSEDLRKKVIYKNVETKDIWVRDYNMFNSLVDKEKYPNIEQVYRFECVDE